MEIKNSLSFIASTVLFKVQVPYLNGASVANAGVSDAIKVRET